jgi:peptide/nickel transport system substrate-binding protein
VGLSGLFRAGGKPFTVSKVDDLTVRFVTSEVTAPFLQLVSGAPVLPRHILAREVRGKTFPKSYAVNSNPKLIVGSGPFRLKDVTAGRSVLLERNPNYHAVDKNGTRLPYLGEVQLNVQPDPGAAAALFLQNQTDVCEAIRPELRPRFEAALNTNAARFVELGAGTECNYIWFNQNTNVAANGKSIVSPTKLKWFRDKKFRQAVSCALDRERMVREIYGGRGEAVYSLVGADNAKWNNPNVARFSYDPGKARALLAEIDIRDRNADNVLEDAGGNPIQITMISNLENPLRSRMAAMICDDLKAIGFKAEYRAEPFQAVVQKINFTFDYDCAIVGLSGGGMDPATQINVIKSTESLHQWFPSQKVPSSDWEALMDQLMDAQMQTLDFAGRKKYFDEVQIIWAEQQPMIAIAGPVISAAVRSRLANVRASIASQFHVTWNIEELYWKEK